MKLIKKLHRRYTKNFVKYLTVGIIWTLLTIFFMWLFIDIFLFPTLIGSAIVVFGMFTTKFFAYRIIDLINKGFLKYASVSISFSLAIIILMWLFIDIFHIKTVISSTIIVYSMFILRFFAFDKIGLMKKDKI